MKKTTNTSAKETKAAKKVTATKAQVQPKKAAAEKAPKPKYNGSEDFVLINSLEKKLGKIDRMTKKASSGNRAELTLPAKRLIETFYRPSKKAYWVVLPREVFSHVVVIKEVEETVRHHDSWAKNGKDSFIVTAEQYKKMEDSIVKAIKAFTSAPKEEKAAA